MKKILTSDIISIGLAIFSMLFGAGNLMYPLQVGMDSGNQNLIGMIGFMLTAVLLPVVGFISMILFDGNYKNFFNRLGKPVGGLLILICMLIIGPVIALPRITTLSHVMIAPFIPWNFLGTITPYSSFIFAIIFLLLTFLMTYRENKIMDILGRYISPLLLLSLAIIITKGIIIGGPVETVTKPTWDIFTANFIRGYETLDLLGGIFFSSIILSILRSTLQKNIQNNPKLLALIGLKSSLIGVFCLALVYIGMSLLGMYHGAGLEFINSGELFREISFKILGSQGAAIIALAVLMACFSTSIALAAIVAEYLHNDIFNNRISYVGSLLLTLFLCLPLSTAGLTHILKLTGGAITYIGYPVLITLTMCNIAYKLFNFKPVKVPVALIFIVAIISYIR